MKYHGNLLSVEFKDPNFLNGLKTIEKRESLNDPWVHYLVEADDSEIDGLISRIKENLLPEKYYAHFYNEDGSHVIVIFAQKVFHLSIEDKEGWSNLKTYMVDDQGVPERQADAKPKKFSEEKEYYSKMPLVT